jgi:hypothetical protein
MRINNVGVNGNAISLDFPVGRYFDLLPGGYIIGFFVKIHWPVFRFGNPVKFPVPI